MKIGAYLESADSMAWSFSARRAPPLPGHSHKDCANCLEYALRWYEKLIARTPDALQANRPQEFNTQMPLCGMAMPSLLLPPGSDARAPCCFKAGPFDTKEQSLYQEEADASRSNELEPRWITARSTQAHL